MIFVASVYTTQYHFIVILLGYELNAIMCRAFICNGNEGIVCQVGVCFGRQSFLRNNYIRIFVEMCQKLRRSYLITNRREAVNM